MGKLGMINRILLDSREGERDSVVVEAATICAMTAIFLVPAVLNGFPFLFADSETYLRISAHPFVPVDRPLFYGLFLKLVHLSLSLWLVAIAQSLILAWLIGEFCLRFFGISSPSKRLILAVLLTLGSSLPWFAANIMPDIFTSVMILAIALLSLAWNSTSRYSRIALVALIATAACVHQANFIVAFWTAPALCLCFLLGRRERRFLNWGVLAASGGVLLGIAAIASVHLFKEHKLSLSSSGPIFEVASLLNNGTALKYLDQACGQQTYRICEQLDDLKAYSALQREARDLDWVFSLYNHFLWQGPLDKLGWFGGAAALQAEPHSIVRGTLAAYPFEVVRAAALNGWRQLFSVRTSDVLCVPFKRAMIDIIGQLFGSSAAEKYRKSEEYNSDINVNWDETGINVFREPPGYTWRDSKSVINFYWIDEIHDIVLIISVLGLIVFVVFRRSHQPSAILITAFLFVFIVGNAMTLGGLSAPADRYQSRVIWLLPLVVGCFALQSVSNKSSVTSSETEARIGEAEDQPA